MKLIIIGCEYSGMITLAVAINDFLREQTGTDFRIIHDHWKIPHTSGHLPFDTSHFLNEEEQARGARSQSKAQRDDAAPQPLLPHSPGAYRRQHSPGRLPLRRWHIRGPLIRVRQACRARISGGDPGYGPAAPQDRRRCDPKTHARVATSSGCASRDRHRVHTGPVRRGVQGLHVQPQVRPRHQHGDRRRDHGRICTRDPVPPERGRSFANTGPQGVGERLNKYRLARATEKTQ